MSKTKELEQRINTLESQLVDAKIQAHKESYIHIPFSWGGIGRFCLLLISGALSYFHFLFLISVGQTYKVWEMFGAKTTEESIKLALWNQLIVCYPLLTEWLLIALTIICFGALVKKGFCNLKRYDDEGLIGGLIYGLIAGLIGGLIYGLIVGLIGGLIVGLIVEFD